jgi:hypothetical protein
MLGRIVEGYTFDDLLDLGELLGWRQPSGRLTTSY